LAPRRILLVLDNLEQVIEAMPEVAALLTACPALKILATSREVLRLAAEYVFPVEPLTLPNPAHAQPPAELAATEAVALFVQRAQAANPSFSLTGANGPTVAAIVHRLDGLPLAVELAAARTRQLPPAALLGQLGARLRILAGGPRDAPARQRTLRDAIAWSYDLLSPEEQAIFRRLTVFAGGFDLEAVEVVCRPREEAGGDFLAGVASLVDKSLVRPEEGANGEPRYRMLETIREYALERLAAHGETEATGRRHAEFFCALAERTERPLSVGNQDLVARWMARLNVDHGNLRAALAWAIDRRATETALRLVGALVSFWFYRGEFPEGRAWAERAIAMDGNVPPPIRVNAMATACQHARLQGDFARALALGEEGLALARSCDDQFGVGNMLLHLGDVAENQRHYGRARAYFTEALAVFQALDEPAWAASALEGLAKCAMGRGDYVEAETCAQQRLALQRVLENPWDLAEALMIVGELARLRGDADRAARSFQESLAIHWREGHRYSIMWRLEHIAVLTGQAPERSGRLLGAAEVLRDEFGMPLEPAWEEEAHDPAVERVHTELGEVAFAAAWAAGRTLPLDAVVAEALAEPPAPIAAVSTRAAHGLTLREMEVLRLLAEGRSDREIGAALFVSHRTVMRHGLA
nr:hypothetical protein [Chloroflexia bacterium]